MDTINNSANPFLDVVNLQKKADGTKYRLLTYCVEQECQEGVLLYNTLSCEMVLLRGSEMNQKKEMPYLIEHWFLVPNDFDDMKLAKEYRNIHELLKKTKTKISSYTILPTTDCNAQCFYCYELGRSRIMMTEKTANDVADYIIHNYQELSNDNKQTVHLSWFGGEPLYNHKVIDIICNRLNAEGVPYRSKMTSNSYLFDKSLAEKACTLWQLKRVQVTLDGTEDIYNRSKAYIYKDGSAYKRVLRNIGLLLDAGIQVIIRMNMDMHNADDLILLSRHIKERFGCCDNLICYSHPLFEVASPTAHLRTEERRNLVYQKQNELKTLLEELGLLRYNKIILKDIPFNQCMADSGQSVVIAPTGHIGLCEHYTDSEFFSHVNTPEQRDEKVIARFRERCEDLELCHDCHVYPQCIRLKMCEEGSLCFPEIRAEKIDKIKKAMLIKYGLWKAKQEDTEEDAFEEC